MNKLGNYKQLR